MDIKTRKALGTRTISETPCSTLSLAGMATFVPYASCYRRKQAMQMLGQGSYFSLFANPPCLVGTRKPLACPAPKMTLRQISQLIRGLKELRLQDSGTSKDTPLPEPSSRSRSDSLQTASQRTESSEESCLLCFLKWGTVPARPRRDEEEKSLNSVLEANSGMQREIILIHAP